ncbi:MAG: hypothetical protein ACRDF5_07205 [bacterium]
MQIIVQEAKTVKGDPNSIILSFDINGIRRPARIKDLFNTLRALKGHQVSPFRLFSLIFAVLDG